MSLSQINWLAGLLEGEGYFGYYNRSHHVTFYSTDKDVARTVSKMCGVECRERNKSGYRNGVKKQFGFTVYGYNARRIMRMVLPFMHRRRRSTITKALRGKDTRCS